MRKLIFVLIISKISLLLDPNSSSNLTNSSSSQNSSNITNIVLTKSDCPVCKCYVVSCESLTKPDIDCVNTFSRICDSQDFITEDNNCNLVCDCCILGQCLSWWNYDCFLFRGYQILSVIFFLFIIIGYFILSGLLRHFFIIVRYWCSDKFTIDWANDQKILNIRLVESIFIRYKHEFDKKISYHQHYSLAMDLFDLMHKQRPIAVNNLHYFLIIVFFFCSTVCLTIYSIVALPSSPRMFSNVFWGLVTSGAILTVLTLFAYFYIRPYSEIINEIICDYERSYFCKIQVIPKINLIQFKFRKQTRGFQKNNPVKAGSFNDLGNVKNVTETEDQIDMVIRSRKESIDEAKRNELADY